MTKEARSYVYEKKYIYFEQDGGLSAIKNRTIAVIGYGNQGRVQALNLRDSGCTVIVGNKKDEYAARAEADNFSVYEIKEALQKPEIQNELKEIMDSFEY